MGENNENQIERRSTKERILDAAIDLFSDNGISAVSVRDIANRVGINQSSMYNHFSSKDELLDAIIKKFRVEFGEVTFTEDRMEEQIVTTEPELFFSAPYSKFKGENYSSGTEDMEDYLYGTVQR